MNQVGKFLEEIFAKWNNNDISYCVLKNYEDLPEHPGRDVDIWVMEVDFQKCLDTTFEVAHDLGWELLAVSLRMRFIGAGEYYFIKNSDIGQLCVLDLSPFLHWKGVSYIYSKILHKKILTHEKGFKVSSRCLEAATMVFRGAMSMMGEMKDEYKAKLVEAVTNDPQGFLEVLEEPFGRDEAEAILTEVRTKNWDLLGRKMAHYHRVILKRALRRRPFFQIRQWVRYYTAIWWARFSPPHGFFLALLGPDGAGKTTIANFLLESPAIQQLFIRRKHCYRRFEVPWKKAVIKVKAAGLDKFEAETRDDGSIVPMNPVKAAIYAIYLATEYLLAGHPFVRWWKSNGGLVVFDRYFYDYLVFEDFSRCPGWLLRLLAKLVPRPDAIVYLKNDPKTIYARKPERSLPEIARQAKVCERLVADLPNSYTIDTSGDPEKIVADIIDIIIKNLKYRNKEIIKNYYLPLSMTPIDKQMYITYVKNPYKMHLADLSCTIKLNNIITKINQVHYHNQFIRVINYHDTFNAHASLLEEHMKFYQEHFTPVSFQDFDNFLRAKHWEKDRPGLIISFDDGTISNFEVAYPLLEKYGFIGWFFVPTNLIKKNNDSRLEWGDVTIEASKKRRPRMNWNQLRELDNMGHVIGSHTKNHCRMFLKTPPEKVYEEIFLSKVELEQQLKHEVSIFAWVGGEEGSYSTTAANMIRKSGYRYAFINCPGPIVVLSNPYSLKRLNIESCYSIKMVKFCFSGLIDLFWYRRTKQVERLIEESCNF